jgi:hypothetical protein
MTGAALDSAGRDCVCTWEANGKRCAYPVGAYLVGETRGFCIFHRRLLASGGQVGADGAEIVERSQSATPKTYAVDAWEAVYGRRARELTSEQKAERFKAELMKHQVFKSQEAIESMKSVEQEAA